MANPNYGRKDAKAPGVDTSSKDLAAKDWYVVPRRLTVPTDLHFYAVDQAKLDGAPSEGETAPPSVQPMRADQTALQIHKWVDYLTVKRSDVAIGDWVIAERVVATRGEPIGPQRVELPYWRRQQNRFTMLADRSARPDDKKYVAAVDVPFTPDGKEPILVDFTRGDSPRLGQGSAVYCGRETHRPQFRRGRGRPRPHPAAAGGAGGDSCGQGKRRRQGG